MEARAADEPTTTAENFSEHDKAPNVDSVCLQTDAALHAAIIVPRASPESVVQVDQPSDVMDGGDLFFGTEPQADEDPINLTDGDWTLLTQQVLRIAGVRRVGFAHFQQSEVGMTRRSGTDIEAISDSLTESPRLGVEREARQVAVKSEAKIKKTQPDTSPRKAKHIEGEINDEDAKLLAAAFWDKKANDVRMWLDISEEKRQVLLSKLTGPNWSSLKVSQFMRHNAYIPFLVMRVPLPPEIAMPTSKKDLEVLEQYVTKGGRVRRQELIDYKRITHLLGPEWTRIRIRAYRFALQHPALVDLKAPTRSQPSRFLGGQDGVFSSSSSSSSDSEEEDYRKSKAQAKPPSDKPKDAKPAGKTMTQTSPASKSQDKRDVSGKAVCSLCGKSGHNQRSCPWQQSEAKSSPRTAAASSTAERQSKALAKVDNKKQERKGKPKATTPVVSPATAAAGATPAKVASGGTTPAPSKATSRATLKKRMMTAMKTGNWDEVFRLLREAPDWESWVYDSYERSLTSGPDAIIPREDSSEDEQEVQQDAVTAPSEGRATAESDAECRSSGSSDASFRRSRSSSTVESESAASSESESSVSRSTSVSESPVAKKRTVPAKGSRPMVPVEPIDRPLLVPKLKIRSKPQGVTKDATVERKPMQVAATAATSTAKLTSGPRPVARPSAADTSRSTARPTRVAGPFNRPSIVFSPDRPRLLPSAEMSSQLSASMLPPSQPRSSAALTHPQLQSSSEKKSLTLDEYRKRRLQAEAEEQAKKRVIPTEASTGPAYGQPVPSFITDPPVESAASAASQSLPAAAPEVSSETSLSDEAAEASLMHTARMYAQMDRWDKTVEQCTRLLDLQRQRGLDKRAISTTLLFLGKAFQELKNPARAVAVYREALDVQRMYLGPFTPEVAQTLYLLGTSLQQVGELESAQAALNDALMIQQQLFEPGHPDLLRTEEAKKQLLIPPLLTAPVATNAGAPTAVFAPTDSADSAQHDKRKALAVAPSPPPAYQPPRPSVARHMPSPSPSIRSPPRRPYRGEPLERAPSMARAMSRPPLRRSPSRAPIRRSPSAVRRPEPRFSPPPYRPSSFYGRSPPRRGRSPPRGYNPNHVPMGRPRDEYFPHRRSPPRRSPPPRHMWRSRSHSRDRERERDRDWDRHRNEANRRYVVPPPIAAPANSVVTQAQEAQPPFDSAAMDFDLEGTPTSRPGSPRTPEHPPENTD